ncbi:uncharacterized protein BP5553_01292 [Venustampulla echinocandica]|uniref:AAA+ ATPase domain-containing protein n=1 Tax=Venustampulla echinocandica TaxID=2656787 RepID=A0A370U0P5_9HELO|nr:uncharacterized protein BP5553_01292 [Venustampulla echinocandica]RDL41313.1 hypothetical protein BP5553_01292 [Venustampulla echinocandica]
MRQTGPPLSLTQPNTPPSSPNLSLSQCFVTSSDAEELVKAVTDMQMTSTSAPKYLKDLFLKVLDKRAEENAEVSDKPKPDSPDSTTSKELVARASLIAFKEVDEIWDDKAYKYTVVESPKPKSINNLDQYVFVVHKNSKENTYFVDVKLFMLRDALREVLCDVPGINILEEKLSIQRNILYNFLPEIELCRDKIDLEDRASYEHISLLIDHIKTSYADLTQRLGALLEAKEITYDLLWAFFKANTLVYTTCPGTEKPRCIKYESAAEETTQSGVEYFHIKGSYLDFDGKILGKVPIETAILKFAGSKPVNSLEAFPLYYHEEEEAVKKMLVECDRRFCSLRGTQHRQYDETAFQMMKGKPRKITIKGRIMVDSVKFLQDNPNYARPSIFKSSKSVGIWHDLDDEPSTRLDESAVKKGVNINELSKEDFLLCSPTVLSYSLENKLYLEFAVADISEICWDESIFGQLKIPANSKELIQALATQHSSRENAHAFDNFVKEKGLGLIILLYGPPGVGKTMTAEALAELLHMPLFTVSAANLSHNSSADLDTQLSKIFDVASHWNTLLLLDEADSYLRRRSDNSQHNALVSVFLRKLEYFTGIMMLTTNQVTEFDGAVQSRIHIGLAYSSLGFDTRKSIWESFLNKPNAKGRVVGFKGTELQDLAERKLNGRQIKNAVRAAHALADFEKVDLAMNHLHKVLDVGAIFENDFKGTGATDNEHAYH